MLCFSSSLSQGWLKMLCFSNSFSSACTKCCVFQFPFPFPVPFPVPFLDSLCFSKESALQKFFFKKENMYRLACLLSHNCVALCLTYVCAQKCHLVFFRSVTMSFKNNSSDNAVKVNDKAQWTLHVFMSSTICSDDTKLATTLFCLFRTKKSPHDWKSQASQHAIKMHDETHHVYSTGSVAKVS